MTFVVFEQFSRTAPLGIRFWDMAAQVPVMGGLVVTARTPQNRVLPMFANSKGIYVLQNVPGLRPFEAGDGSEEFWADAPVPQSYQIEVRDPSGHYHPFTFEADVPTRKILSWECVAAPPLAPLNRPDGTVPVYSTAIRHVPGGMAVLRADLYDPAAKVPAAWATLEVLLDGVVLGRGIADTRGCVLVAFPYPEPIDTTPDSPTSFGVPLTEQIWPLSLRASYASVASIPNIIDLCSVLNQPQAELWRTWTSPANRQPFTTVDLRYGREAVAVSFNAANISLSRLYITPV